MKLDPTLLRSRRFELGLSTRELANAAVVSTNVIARLEDDGDVSELSVRSLTALLDTLSMDLTEVMSARPKPDGDEELVERLGSLLAAYRRAVPASQVADELDVTLEEVESAADALSWWLRPAGLRVHRGIGGLSVVPAITHQVRKTRERTKLHFLSVLDRGDLILLHEVMTGDVSEKVSRRDRKLRVHKLEGAGLVHVAGAYLRVTPEFLRACEPELLDDEAAIPEEDVS